MADDKTLVVGEPADRAGDIVTNDWVGARSARALESSVGFHAGRLDAGWWLLVLKQRLTPADFKFSGLTLRSGGRYGLPTADAKTDELRLHVHDGMLVDYGKDEVAAMQRRALDNAQYEGPKRLVKIRPVTPHSKTMAPSEQYPMGAGGPQWTLIRPCRFLVAIKVDENGIARTPGFSVFLGESARYDDRAKLARYIETA